MKGRCRRDAGEMQWRYSGDTREIHGRYTGDMGEMWRRYRRWSEGRLARSSEFRFASSAAWVGLGGRGGYLTLTLTVALALAQALTLT